MASKRRVAMLNSFSLYDDLEAESSKSEENRKNEEQNERDEGPTNKRAREEQNDMSLTKRTNDGVGRWTIASLFQKARFVSFIYLMKRLVIIAVIIIVKITNKVTIYFDDQQSFDCDGHIQHKDAAYLA